MRSSDQTIARWWFIVDAATNTNPRWPTDGVGGAANAATIPATCMLQGARQVVIRSISVQSLPTAATLEFTLVDASGAAWPTGNPFRFNALSATASQRQIPDLAIEVDGPFGVAPGAVDATAKIVIEFEPIR